jgi:hypothetical protein
VVAAFFAITFSAIFLAVAVAIDCARMARAVARRAVHGGASLRRSGQIPNPDDRRGEHHQAAANHNKSIYHAFGYASNGRLGATATSTGLIGQMNNKTRAACENAKAAGITVYTIAFRLENDANTRALLASCASSAAEPYAASNGAALAQAFAAIAREIAKLRFAR